MTSKLTAALRAKYRTPEAALAALGIDAAILDEGKDSKMNTRFRAERKLGRDEEDADIADEIRDVINDPESDFADLIALVVEAAPEKVPEISATMREIGSDARGIHAWARDKREMKRLGRDKLNR